MAITVNAKDFSAALQELLKEYGEDVNRAAREAVTDIAKDTAKELRATAPKKLKGNGGAYAKSWSYKPVKVSGLLTEYVVYSRAPHYRLTHLLEDGHKIANGYGSYTGTVAARPHIAAAEEKAVRELENKVRERIESI